MHMTNKTQKKPGTHPGAQVSHLTDDTLVIGEVVASDEWYDTLRLRGVAAEDQVLVLWETPSGNGWCGWAEIAELEGL